MQPPHEYPRRILVAVTGLSPQVVTETLYALAVEANPAFLPTEIRLITTREGARGAELSLLHPESGWFHRLRADYDLPPIAFGPDYIHVLRGMQGEPLGDIRSLDDNRCAADNITDMVRELTRDEASALQVSIAGGRKTMGFYLGYALSLYGREQDRLSHVLVSPHYESNPDFFYPTPYSRVIYTATPNRRPLDTRDAEITLADIPFVRLSEGLNSELLAGQASFSAAVAQAQRALPKLALVLDPATRTLEAGGESFVMSRARFAFYWMLAERARQRRPGLHWSEHGVEKEFLAYRAQLVNPASGAYERAEEAYAHGFTAEDVNPLKAHIKRELERHLGRRRAAPYLVHPLERIPGTKYTRFGLRLPPGAIRIVGGKVAVPDKLR